MTRVVFVPGFMQRGEAWAPVADRLSRRYSRVLVDHRVHDREGRLAEIAEAAGEGGAVLCGYSLGGRLSLHAVLREPARYRGLVTLGSSAGLEAQADRDARGNADERLASWMERSPIESVVDVWERQPLFADQSEQLIADQRPGRLSFSGAELARLLRSAGQGVTEPLWHHLPALELPLLAMAGARDERYLAAARRMADLVPNGRAEAIEEAGHAAHLQRPDAVTARVERFLGELEATA
ncbi:MAG: alpha/beta fold hydrolase [Actinomycetota bacterium]|nr:alpha/beta fold hydrolase [Actinomycetota bacterium]